MHPTKTLMCLCTLKSRCKNMALHLKEHAPCDLCTHHCLMIYIWLNSHDLAHFLHWVNVYVWRHSQKCTAWPHLGALFWEHLPLWGIALHIYCSILFFQVQNSISTRNWHMKGTEKLEHIYIYIYIYIGTNGKKSIAKEKEKQEHGGTPPPNPNPTHD